jgi:subtilisin-like proprotein convertase family protein
LDTNNANFTTPPDGISGLMQMYVFDFPIPNRDGDLDQEIVLHELTHGVSNRLHANAAGLNSFISRGMGEGWSDYYARALLSTADEDVNGLYASGAYATFQLSILGTDNYYYGIRRFPYAVKTAVGANGKPHNPLTFADTDQAQLDTTDGAFPESPLGFSFNRAIEPHNLGEIWCMTLLEMRARLINRLGFDDGNKRALQVVTDGMKLDPVSPNMLQGRNSILLADCAGFGGSDEMDIWAGFAARGMGFSAKYNSATSVTEAFDMPNLSLGGVTFTDNSCAADAFADPGDPLTLNIPLSNPFCATAANGVSISVNGGGSVTYGDIPAGATLSQGVPFTVPSDAACGSQLTLNAVITSSIGTVTRTFNLRIGKPASTLTASYSSGNLAVPIPTFGSVDIPVNVTDIGSVADVNVRVRLNHTFDFDVVLTLIAPDGTTVRLVENRGGLGQNFGTGTNDCSGVPTVFDDSASIPIGAGTAPFASAFRPESPLSAFNGKNANGVWILRATDVFPVDNGTLGCVQLEINRQLFTCNVPVTTVISTTGQYSDGVLLKANVTNVTCPGRVDFSVNGTFVGSAPFAGGSATLPYKITLAQGNYPIVATYFSTPPDKTSSGSGTLSVTREDALVTPAASNPTIVKVNSPKGTAGPINLCAAVNETNDESPGDISLANPVTFTLTPFVSGGQAITQTATTSGGGVGGTITACAALNNVPVNVYDVGISVGGNNYTGSVATALVVFDPTLGSFSGIGAVVHNGRNGAFMFNVKYKKDGTPQGGLIYAERRPTGFVRLQTSAVQSLSTVGNTGVIFGKASVNGVANHTFRATVVDGSKSGRGDRFGLQVLSPSGTIVTDMTFDPINLRGGNIRR